MNRAERRRNGRPKKYRARLFVGAPHTLAGVQQVTECPDCDSDVTITELSPGVYRGQVAHDDTCPWYAQLKQELA